MANRCQKGDGKVNFLKRILLFIIISISTFSFKLEGITFNKSLENGYKEFIIHNNSLKKERYKISILPAGDVDVTNSIEVFPKIITIEPQSEQIFKLFGTGKQKLENKEYSFTVKFDPIVIPTLAKGEDGKTSGNATIPLAPSVQMKGYGGIINFSQALELTDMSFNKNEKGKLIFRGKLHNKSHGAAELAIKFSNKNESRVDSEAIGGIEANSVINLEIEIGTFTEEKQIKYIDFYDENLETLKRVVRE